MKADREQDLVKSCLDLLRLHAIPAWRNNSGAFVLADRGGKKRFFRAGLVGSSDILGLIPPTGRLIAVEVKIRPNKPTADQEAFLAMVNGSGGLGVVVYDLRDLEKVLEGV